MSTPIAARDPDPIPIPIPIVGWRWPRNIVLDGKSGTRAMTPFIDAADASRSADRASFRAR
jgi:hypothetical protein